MSAALASRRTPSLNGLDVVRATLRDGLTIDNPLITGLHGHDIVRSSFAGRQTFVLRHPDYVDHVLHEACDRYRKSVEYELPALVAVPGVGVIRPPRAAAAAAGESRAVRDADHRKRVRDEATTFILAGHETTANALSWMWYLLALNAGARERMLAEVDAVLGQRRPTAVDLANLPWTTACFQEAMRMFPPAWAIPRTAVEDDVIDGHRIPRGASILIPIHAIHFGGGRRICIGSSFALMEDRGDHEPAVRLRARARTPGRARGDADAQAAQGPADDRAQAAGVKLAGARVVITGAGSGIGAATAHRFARKGAEVIAVDIDLESAERIARECRGNASARDCEVSDRDAVSALAALAFRLLRFAPGPVQAALARAEVL